MEIVFKMNKVSLFLLSLLVSCAPGTFNTDKPIPPEASFALPDAVVTLVTPQIVNDEDGVPRSVAYEPKCNAFFATDSSLAFSLVTAKHCVDDVGSIIKYERKFGLGTATVEYLSPNSDTAFLSINDEPNLTALEFSDVGTERGDVVVSYSSLKHDTSAGYVTDDVGRAFRTTQTIEKGWSGSPVVNESGKVVGLISKCRPAPVYGGCEIGYALVSKVY